MTRSTESLAQMGYHYSVDKRRRRREHRQAARDLARQGGGSIIASVCAWHLYNARWVGR